MEEQKTKRPWRGTRDSPAAYEPDWKNGHVIKRAQKVLDWSSEYLIGKYGSAVPLHLSAKGFANVKGEHIPGLNDIFGPKGNPLGDYLRALVLIPVSESYSPGEKSMSYRISREGYETTQRNIANVACIAYGDTNLDPLDRLVRRHAEELQTLTFKYRDSSDRLWHGLQNLPRGQKRSFWTQHGLVHDYDIAACAPTILFQLAKRQGIPDVLLSTLQSYLDDRSSFREHVAALTGLDLDDAKKLVNSMFNGAKLGANPYWASFKLMEYDHEAMERLTSDPQVIALKENIKRVWKRIALAKRADTILPLSDILQGKEQPDWSLRKSSEKWNVYFQYERQVLDTITAYLTKNQIRHFTEHDGFRTERKVNLCEVQTEILRVTGFELEIEQKT